MKSNAKCQIIILIAAFVGMVEVAHAFYDPSLQRWINRDPLGDIASLPVMTALIAPSLDDDGEEMPDAEFFDAWTDINRNLYATTGNNPVNSFDPFGECPLANPANAAAYGGEPGPSTGVSSGQAIGFMAGAIAANAAVAASAVVLPEVLGPGIVAAAKKKGTEAARAALGKGPKAQPGAPLSPGMKEALKKNMEAAQKTLDNAKKGLNRAGNPISKEQAARAEKAMQERIANAQKVLDSGCQAPKN